MVATFPWRTFIILSLVAAIRAHDPRDAGVTGYPESRSLKTPAVREMLRNVKRSAAMRAKRVSKFEDPELMESMEDSTHHYNVLLGHLWGNFGWVFAPRLGNLGPAVFTPFETIVDYTHKRVVLIRLDSAGRRAIDVPAYTRKTSVPLPRVPTGLGKMSGLSLAVTPCNTLDTTDAMKNVIIKQIDTGSPEDGPAILGYPFLSSFGVFGINQQTHEFILYR